MKDAGHRDAIDAALRFEKIDRTPVNNFTIVTAARSAGVLVKDARYEPELSAKLSIDFAMKTKSDFVKPIVDSQIPFIDLGMDVYMPDDDYGRVRSTYISDLSEVDDIAFFDPKKASECPHFDRCILQALAATEKALPEDLHICGLSWGPISTAGYLMGTEDLIFSLMMGEEAGVRKLIEKCAVFVAEQEKAQIDAGASVMWMADPTSSEDIIAPDMFKTALSGTSLAISSVKKEYSDVLSFLHVCGNTKDLIPLIPETGADCFSFDHAVDPAVAREAAGKKVPLMGNIDPVKYIMNGDPASIRKESFRIIEACGAEGGLILAPGCETPISSPDENVLAMCQAGRDYWKQ